MGVVTNCAFTTRDNLTDEEVRLMSDALKADLGEYFFDWTMLYWGEKRPALRRTDSLHLREEDLVDGDNTDSLIATPGRVLVQVAFKSEHWRLGGTIAAALAAEYILRVRPDAEFHYGGNGISRAPVTAADLWAEVNEIADKYDPGAFDSCYLLDMAMRTPESMASVLANAPADVRVAVHLALDSVEAQRGRQP